MIIIHNHLGGIEFTKSFFSSLISTTVENCYGVAAMNASGAKEVIADKIPLIGELFDIDKGTKIRISGGNVSIAIHISVMYGINVSAVVNSIKNKLRYAVEEQTNLSVQRIDVFIDGLTN